MPRQRPTQDDYPTGLEQPQYLTEVQFKDLKKKNMEDKVRVKTIKERMDPRKHAIVNCKTKINSNEREIVEADDNINAIEKEKEKQLESIKKDHEKWFEEQVLPIVREFFFKTDTVIAAAQHECGAIEKKKKKLLDETEIFSVELKDAEHDQQRDGATLVQLQKQIQERSEKLKRKGGKYWLEDKENETSLAALLRGKDDFHAMIAAIPRSALTSKPTAAGSGWTTAKHSATSSASSLLPTIQTLPGFGTDQSDNLDHGDPFAGTDKNLSNAGINPISVGKTPSVESQLVSTIEDTSTATSGCASKPGKIGVASKEKHSANNIADGLSVGGSEASPAVSTNTTAPSTNSPARDFEQRRVQGDMNQSEQISNLTRKGVDEGEIENGSAGDVPPLGGREGTNGMNVADGEIENVSAGCSFPPLRGQKGTNIMNADDGDIENLSAGDVPPLRRQEGSNLLEAITYLNFEKVDSGDARYIEKQEFFLKASKLALCEELGFDSTTINVMSIEEIEQRMKFAKKMGMRDNRIFSICRRVRKDASSRL